MGKAQSKQRESSKDGPRDPNKLSPLCQLMREKYPGCCNQLDEWEKLGLSDRQLMQLKGKLEEKEEGDSKKSESMLKRQRKGFTPFQSRLEGIWHVER